MLRPSYYPSGFSDRSTSRLGGWGGAILLHVGVILLLLLDRPQASAHIEHARPIEVQLLEPARPATPMQQTLTQKPKSQPSPPKLAQSQPQPRTEAISLPKPEVVPSPPIVATAAPVSSPVSVAPVQAPGPVRAEPTQVVAVASVRAIQPAQRSEPLIEARFDANYLSNPQPVYPMASRRLGEAGVVRLRVFVDIEGQALKVELERSSGYPRLDQSALDTVANWRFVPARRGATPEASWVVVPLNFSLS